MDKALKFSPEYVHYLFSTRLCMKVVLEVIPMLFLITSQEVAQFAYSYRRALYSKDIHSSHTLSRPYPTGCWVKRGISLI